MSRDFARFEVAAHRYVDLSDADGGEGVSLEVKLKPFEIRTFEVK